MIMQTVIGIDISKNKANMAVATDLAVVKETVISLDVLGFNGDCDITSLTKYQRTN